MIRRRICGASCPPKAATVPNAIIWFRLDQLYRDLKMSDFDRRRYADTHV